MSLASNHLKDLLLQDIRQYIKFSADFSGGEISPLKQLSSFLTPSLMCCFLYRLSHWFYNRNIGPVAQLIAFLNYVVHKADISPATIAGGGLYIPHTVGIVFYGTAGENLTLYGRSLVAPELLPRAKVEDTKRWPVLGDNIIVGAYSLVIGEISVGDDSIVAPQCVVMQSIPKETIALPPENLRMNPAHGGD